MSRMLTTLELIRQKLNETFKNLDPRTEDWVILSNIVDQQGNLYETAQNKVVMLLANIQYETVISTYNPAIPVKGNQFGLITPPLFIDLFVLFYANFYNANYPVGIGAISQTISFFQQNPWFTPSNLPGLDPDIEKLTFEMVNLGVAEVNYLLGMLGVKYLPSVFYKVRFIPFRGDAMQAEIAGVQGVR